MRGVLAIVAITLIATACNDQWDDHVGVGGKTLQGTTLDAVRANPELSVFYEMLVKTEYDAVLNGDYELTVLAPDNAALAEYKSKSINEMKTIIRNHISFLTYDAKQLAAQASITMINGKRLSTSLLKLDAANSDVLCNNGVLHVVKTAVMPAQNIDEYLQTIAKGTYIQLDALYAQTRKVMDEDKSVQIGVNDEGKAVYDTVWTTRNHFFEVMPVANEDSLYTFVVLDNENFKILSAKYAKYMQQNTVSETDSLATDELIRDLVFHAEKTTALSGVQVDFRHATTVKEYKASNGLVRVMNGVDIKLKDNKIKPILIEAESFLSTQDATVVSTRQRSYASGGWDVMISGISRQKRLLFNEDGTPILNTDGTQSEKTYQFAWNTNKYTAVKNFYLLYNARVNSVDYDIYWLSYDDLASHVAQDEFPESTLTLTQKLFASMPGEKVLSRNSDGLILNNYLKGETGNLTAFVASSLAGVIKEEHLAKWTLEADSRYPLAKVEGASVDPYVFSVPKMGTATFMVCNTTNAATGNGGMMFLDYIKLVPRIAEGD